MRKEERKDGEERGWNYGRRRMDEERMEKEKGFRADGRENDWRAVRMSKEEKEDEEERGWKDGRGRIDEEREGEGKKL
jgi:hypothetical protein